MTTEELDTLRYPIGRFKAKDEYSKAEIEGFIQTIEGFPTILGKAVLNFSEEQFDTPYRPDGWTIRQVIHHLADSHINSYIRFRWALTEDVPTIKPYEEQLWAELPDAKSAPVVFSLNLLESLHARWTILLKSLTDSDLEKQFIHPQHQKKNTLAQTIAMYDWHCLHHLNHILQLKNLKAWP